MGKKSSPSAPAAPDPYKTAQAQGQMNKDTAIAQAQLNMVNEYNPYGQSVYTQTGTSSQGVPTYRRDVTLSPEQQRIYDEQSALQGDLSQLAREQTGRISESISQPFSYEGMPEAPQASEEARQQVIDAMYGQYQSRLDPRFQQEQTAMETKLANQGIAVGSPAYNQAMESFNRSRNDAYTSALNQSIMGGGQEQSRLFGLQGNARERAIQEQAYLRNLPLQEAAQLMGTAGGTQLPQFSATPQTGISTTDLVGPVSLAQQSQMNAYNQGMASQSANRGGLYGLMGTGMMAASNVKWSDVRLKENIEPVGTLPNGINVYSYDYIWGGPRQVGVMAQEVIKVIPEAVTIHSNGYMSVDYGKVMQ